VSGLVAGSQEPPSRYSNVPASSALNSKVGVVSCVAAAGATSIAVTGAIVSIRTVCDWTPVSFPIVSNARALTVVTPSAATVNAPA
jgi:hypothetical protein